MGKRGSGKGKRGGDDKGTGRTGDTNRNQADMAITGPSGGSKIWIIVAAVFFLISVAAIVYALKSHSEISNYDSNLVNCTMEVDRLEQEIEDINNDLRRAKSDLDAMSLGQVNRAGLSEEYVELYKKRGLRLPGQSIIADLVKHPELIPYKAPEGRSYRFSRRQEIHVLSHNRVLAVFSDGGIYGWLLLKYSVRENGTITWGVIESHCPRCEK
jgi:hypothetical protein